MSRPHAPRPARTDSILVELLFAPYRALIDRLHERLDAAGYGDIRPAHGNVMGNLSTAGNRATELAAAARLTKQTMQYLVEDLEALGYVERVPDPDDARARLIRFTPKGRAARRAAAAAFRAIEGEWEAALGRQKMETLRGLLAELQDATGGAEAPR